MSDRIRRNIPFLKALLQSRRKKQRKALIKVASEDNIDAVAEGALNTLRGNVPLTATQKRRLSAHKDKIRKLAHKRISNKKKKTFLVQAGGFLPIFIPPLLSAAGALTGRIIASAAGI